MYNNHYLWCFCFVILLFIDYDSLLFSSFAVVGETKTFQGTFKLLNLNQIRLGMGSTSNLALID